MIHVHEGYATDEFIISELKAKALEIMHEEHSNQDANQRADRLEIAHRYMLCCAILNNEIPFGSLTDLTNLCP